MLTHIGCLIVKQKQYILDVKWLRRLYFNEEGKVATDNVIFETNQDSSDDNRHESEDESSSTCNDNNATKARKGNHDTEEIDKVDGLDKYKRKCRKQRYTGDVDVQSKKNRTVTFLDLQDEDDEEIIEEHTNNTNQGNSNTTVGSNMASAASLSNAVNSTPSRTTTRSGRQSTTRAQFTYRVLGETGSSRSLRNAGISVPSQSTSGYATDEQSSSNETENETGDEDNDSDIEVLNSSFIRAELQLYYAMHVLNDFERVEIATVAGITIVKECFRTNNRP